MSTSLAYVGTYSRDGGRGIVVLEFCSERGRFLREVQQIDVEDASYLALHPGGRALFCVNEVRSLAGAATGGMSEFEIEPGTGLLRFRQQWRSGGMTPAHVAIDAAGEWLGVANYRGANVAFGRFADDGHLLTLEAQTHFVGSSVHPERQTQPHPHQVVFHRGAAWIPQLGSDRIACVRRESSGNAAPVVSSLPAGMGPRHLAFSASGEVCFVLGELSSELAVLALRSPSVPMELLALHSTRQPGAAGPNQPAALKLHPGGRWLFCSNRGDDTVAVFAVAEPVEEIELRQVMACGGRWPRDLTVTPDGRWLVVANQHSGNLAAFPIAPETGRIGPVCERYTVTAPACVLFGAVRK